MWGRRGSTGRSERSLLAWIGLLVLAGAVVWLQVTAGPRSLTTIREEPKRAAPFALVVIDPGHGGQDSGTIKNGIAEKNLTLDVAHRLERLLQERGIVVALPRADDTYVSLQDRAIMANNQPESVFVSIHFDEGGRSAAT